MFCWCDHGSVLHCVWVFVFKNLLLKGTICTRCNVCRQDFKKIGFLVQLFSWWSVILQEIHSSAANQILLSISFYAWLIVRPRQNTAIFFQTKSLFIGEDDVWIGRRWKDDKGQISAFRATPLPQHRCPNILNMKAARREEFEEVLQNIKDLRRRSSMSSS